jgi:transposase
MKIFAALETIDFRKGIDGLAAACRNVLQKDPFSGALFLFRNRNKKSLKILVYDGQGFWLCTKRLSKGKFYWWPDRSEISSIEIEAQELQTLLWNGNPSSASFAENWRKI